MGEKNDNKNPEEKFSDDPQENLRIENEILKLKMKAESNAFFGGNETLPPDIENAFLQHVQQFEDAWKNVKTIKVYDLINRPAFKHESVLSDDEMPAALESVLNILEENGIVLHVEGEYSGRTIYKFITEELFEHETDDVMVPGMTKNFTYEEFHPNHKLDIHARTMDFLKSWFEQRFNKYSWELNDNFILADGSSLPKNEVLKKIQNIFDSYTSFENCKFHIDEISFQWNDEQATGLGHAEGAVKYDAIMENGETVPIEGPFKLYMSCEHGWWNIFYFVFPGFTW